MDDNSRLDVDYCERLTTLALEGDAQAWKALVDHVWPALLRVIVTNRAMRSSRKSDDHVRDVATNVVEKLGRNDLRGLRQYPRWKEQHPGKSFKDWLFIVTANASRDHARAVGGRATRSEKRDHGRERAVAQHQAPLERLSHLWCD